MAEAAPLLTPTATGLPITVLPLRTVKVTAPSSTTPPELVTVALRDTFWLAGLYAVEVLAAVVVVVPG